MFNSFIKRVAPAILSIAMMDPVKLIGPPQRIYAGPMTLVRKFAKVGRNEPCPCGSGKKSKVCHN